MVKMCGWLVFNLHRSIYGSNPSNYRIEKKKKKKKKGRKKERFKINFKKK